MPNPRPPPPAVPDGIDAPKPSHWAGHPSAIDTIPHDGVIPYPRLSMPPPMFNATVDQTAHPPTATGTDASLPSVLTVLAADRNGPSRVASNAESDLTFLNLLLMGPTTSQTATTTTHIQPYEDGLSQ